MKLRKLLHHLVALVIALLFTLPLYWMITNSLRPVGAPPPVGVEWWPAEATWSNYAAVFDVIPVGQQLGNSLLIVAIAVPLTELISSLSGFALAQLQSRWQSRILNVSIGLLIVPAASVWIFRFQIMRWLGLVDTVWAIVLPAFGGTNPLYMLLFFWTFRRVPQEMFEAAQLDGASAWTAWWRVARPFARPTSAAVTVLSFVFYWSDFVTPVLYLYNANNYTLPIGLQTLKQLDATNWPLLMALAVIMTLPTLLLFIALQRRFLSTESIASLVRQK